MVCESFSVINLTINNSNYIMIWGRDSYSPKDLILPNDTISLICPDNTTGIIAFQIVWFFPTRALKSPRSIKLIILWDGKNGILKSFENGMLVSREASNVEA